MHIFTEVAEEHAHHTELPIPAEAFGILALVGLVAALLVTYAFRHIGSSH